MSNIDKRALREAAEKALAAMKRLLMMPNDELFDEALLNVDGDVDAANAFNLLTGPETVLALLDELEATEKQLASWRSLAKKNIEEHEKAVAALDTARHRICELESKLTQNESWSMAAQKYIAELEAREVVLPQRYSMLHRVDFDEPYHTEMVYKQHQVLEALHDAGVNVAAAGKGA